MKIIRMIVILLLLLQSGIITAQTYVEIPLGGNSFLTSGTSGSVTNSGWTNWNKPETIFSTYFRVNQTGSLNLYLKYTSDTDGNVIEAKCKGQTFTVTLPKSTTTRIIQLGTISNCPVGYVQVDIKGITLKGSVYAKPTELLINGTASTNVNFVPTTNMYFGRRGPSVHMGYTVPAGKIIEWFYNEVTIPVGMDPIGTYSMANGFGQGYFGMQVNSATERRILFSVWSPYETDDPNSIPESKKIKLVKKGEGVYTGEFGNEGSGGQSYLKYMWKAGNTYKFLNRVRPSANGYSEYTAYFYAPEEGKWRLIAQFLRPEIQTYYTRPHSFLESFSPNNGYIQRKSLYKNQWARTKEGQWIELTEGTFTNDATGSRKERMDFKGGLDNDGFFLENCGFFNDYVNAYTKYKRPATNKAPEVDVNALDNDGGVTTNTPPTVSIASPVNGSSVSTSSITVTANASDADGTIVKVEFYLNGVLKSTDTSSPYSSTLSTLNTGANTIMVKAFDNKSATSSASIAVTYASSSGGGSSNCNGVADWVASKAYNGGDKVHYNGYIYTAAYWTQNNRPDQNYGAYGKPWKGDRVACTSEPTNTPPTISFTSPGNGETVSAPSVNVAVNATDADGSVSKVEFYLNGVLTETKASAPYTASLATLNAGQNSISAKVFDDKGLDASANLNLIYFAPIQNLRADAISTTSIVLAWEPSTGEPQIAQYNVYDANQNKYIATLTTNKYQHKGLIPDTEYSYYVRAYTAAGNPSDKSAILTVRTGGGVVANTPPTISISSPANNATVNTISVSVSANASDADGAIAKVEFFLNGTLISSQTTAPYFASLGTLRTGENSIVAKAYDDRGATAESAISVNYSAPAANIPPTISIISPINGSTVKTSNVAVSLNVADADGSINKIEVYLNGTLKSTLTSITPSINIGTLFSGVNTIMAKVFDNEGASTTASVSVTYQSTSDDCLGIPAWSSTKIYNTGDQVRDGDIIYKANHWTQNNRPSQNFGSGKPWAVVSKCDGSIGTDAFGDTQVCGGVKILVWKKDNTYDQKGVKVVYEGKIYECQYWTKGNIPNGTGPWKLIGVCK